jgi:hypothetical protein
MADANGTQTSGGRDVWDFLIVLVVVGVLGGLTYWLVHHYTKVSDVAQILGIVVPAFAAVFGVTLGYAGGNATGKTAGREQAKKQLKQQLAPYVQDLQASAEAYIEPVRKKAANESGHEDWILKEEHLRGAPLMIPRGAMDLPAKAAQMSELVNAL